MKFRNVLVNYYDFDKIQTNNSPFFDKIQTNNLPFSDKTQTNNGTYLPIGTNKTQGSVSNSVSEVCCFQGAGVAGGSIQGIYPP